MNNKVCRKIAAAIRHYGILILLVILSAVTPPATASELVCNTIDVYMREGCPHCADAKLYLQQLVQRHSSLNIRYHELNSDPNALEELLAFSNNYGIEQPGVPTFIICDAAYVGFSVQGGSDIWIENQLIEPQMNDNRFQVDTPLGAVSVTQLGLPLFTIALGLIDGFNPCAMWVLLFLLSILVNIRNRGRVFLIAGTFVAVSGLVYFAFMAAWLNLFLVIGVIRWLQISIGILAMAIGLVHVKDFVAYGRGFSLSIRDSVKPGIYRRARDVLHAQNLWAAMLAVTIVAVMVNFIELLCTAGLPALYTQVLTLRPMTDLQYYAYLGLYNLAYVFDDALMVTIAVYSMHKFKLQEKQGRWLKLLSGFVILALGVLLIFAPDLLI